MFTRALVFLLTVTGLACGATAPSAAPSEPPPNLSPAEVQELRHYRDAAEAELRGNILAFWMRHTVDRERGGFFGEISNDLVVKKDAPRGSLLTSRVLWTFSAAYRRYRDPAYLEMATWAYDDLRKRFWDPAHGGVYWLVAADGRPLNRTKQVYGEVFALYALAEYHRASQSPEALELAVTLFRLVEQHAQDRRNGGYFEACSEDWTPQKDPRRSALEPYGVKSQNTHLHVMEAYSNLLRVWPTAEMRAAHRELLIVMLERILNSQTKHLVLFMDEHWQPTRREISFGHDIEASWLLTEAAEVLGEASLLERVHRVAVEIAKVTLAEGVDQDGSLFYEADEHGVTRTDREWWPQAEAVVGFYNAYQLSGDARYRRAAFRTWDYIDSHLVDKKHGEWFRAVSRDGRISRQPKVSMWKCPYHNGRSCLELIERIDRTLGAGAAPGKEAQSRRAESQ